MNGFFVIRPSAVGAGALLVGVLETVEAELTNLRKDCLVNTVGRTPGWIWTYLVAAGTRAEVFIREIKFFDTQGAAGEVSDRSASWED